MKGEGKRSVVLLALCLVLQSWASPLVATPNALDRYHVIWDTPSRDASGSMPIGNGEAK
jgi:hypothetical protein